MATHGAPPTPVSDMELFQDFLNHGSVCLHAVDTSGIIQRANQTELELLGDTPEKYIGQSTPGAEPESRPPHPHPHPHLVEGAFSEHLLHLVMQHCPTVKAALLAMVSVWMRRETVSLIAPELAKDGDEPFDDEQTLSPWAILRARTAVAFSGAGLVTVHHEDWRAEEKLVEAQRQAAFLVDAGLTEEAEALLEQEWDAAVAEINATQMRPLGGSVDGVYEPYTLSERYVVFRIYRPVPCSMGHMVFFIFRPLQPTAMDGVNPNHWYLAGIPNMAWHQTAYPDGKDLPGDVGLRTATMDAVLDCREMLATDRDARLNEYKAHDALCVSKVSDNRFAKSMQILYACECAADGRHDFMPPREGWGWFEGMMEVTRYRADSHGLSRNPTLDFVSANTVVQTMDEDRALSALPVLTCADEDEEEHDCCDAHRLLEVVCVFCEVAGGLRFTDGWKRKVQNDLYSDGTDQIWLPCSHCGNASYHEVYYMDAQAQEKAD
eukprot:TRINITY_DN850_c0_g1_i1.p1 TRINITY_DN850_c0_g1~~TRINITY_DN850_c0_g1_i1.p1  ORF type:complete len:492 (+),score=124.89 TRINITY_DN850_c0_g1_i1:49-1524(+)